MFLSIIIPVFNEEESLPSFYKALTNTLSGWVNMSVEVIFVDDHSSDKSIELLKQYADQNSIVKVIRLSKNYGSHTAIIAGLRQAKGDCAVFIAADMQDPPEVIEKMIAKRNEGYHIVWAVRSKREGIPFLEKLLSKITYKLVNWLGHITLPPSNADFALLDRKAINAMNASIGSSPSLGVIISNLGFNTTLVSYEKRKREFGKSKWSLGKKLTAFADLFVATSFAPIRLMSYLGLLCSIFGFLYSIKVIITRMVTEHPIDGWATMMVFILIMGGVQLLMLGILGEYLWRNLKEAEKKPLYFIEYDSDIK